MISNTSKGYILGAAASITYGMNPLFVLPLYENGMDADSVLFFRYFFGIVILGAMLYIRQPRGVNEPYVEGQSKWNVFRLKWRQAIILACYGVLMAMSSLGLFLSYNYMDAGIASTMLFVYPVIVAVLMAVFHREHLSLQTVICILTALLGIFLLYQQGDGATLSMTGTLLVMVSAFTYALYLVEVNRHGISEIPTLKVTFYVLLFGLGLYLGRSIYNGGIAVPTPDKWYLWLNLVALGLLPTAISFLCTTAAIQYIGSTPVAILGALEPATAVFFGIVVFGEELTPREFTGLMLIILAVTAVVAGGNISHQLTRFRKLFPKHRSKV